MLPSEGGQFRYNKEKKLEGKGYIWWKQQMQ